MKLKLLLFLCTALLATMAIGQTNDFTYNYDNAGNRISRGLTVKSAELPQNLLEQLSNDMTGDNIGDGFSGELKITVYPNPTTGKVSIETNGTELSDQIKLALFDIHGRQIINIQNADTNSEIDLTDRANGVYFLRVHTSNKVSDWKIIKQ
jgi:hypothetical protein